ncbi:MAG TPA: SAM-dependent methyltransferase [Nakamurella sp.]
MPWDVTPGVPAYAAAAALLGRELTMPEVVQTVVLTRAQARSTPMPDTESLERLAATRSTLVLHLAITRTRELAERLIPFYGADCPAAVVSRARWCPGRPRPTSWSCATPCPASPISSSKPTCGRRR